MSADYFGSGAGCSGAGLPACFGGGFSLPLCFIVTVLTELASYSSWVLSVLSPSGGIGPGPGGLLGPGVVILVTPRTGAEPDTGWCPGRSVLLINHAKCAGCCDPQLFAFPHELVGPIEQESLCSCSREGMTHEKFEEFDVMDDFLWGA